MKIISVVILLLNVLNPNWIASKFFNSALDQQSSTTINFSQQSSFEVFITSDSTIRIVTDFQIFYFSNKWTSEKEQMGDLTKSENRVGVVLKGLMMNEYPKRNCVFYLMMDKDHLDLYSNYKLNETGNWTIWREVKYRDIDEGVLRDLNGYNYWVDDRGEFCKYFRSYLDNKGEQIKCGHNFYLSDEEGKFKKHYLSIILFNRGSGKLNNDYIYTKWNKSRQFNTDKDALLINEASEPNLKYSVKILYKHLPKDYQLLIENEFAKCKDNPARYIRSFNESIKNAKDISDHLAYHPKLSFFYNNPKENNSAPSWCYEKYKVRNNSKCMHEYLIECLNKSNNPKHAIKQG